MELTDDTLALPHYVTLFELEMSDVDEGVGAVNSMYATIEAIDPGTRTANQVSYYNLYRLLAAYSVARQLLGSLAMFAPKRIQDGRAAVERVDDPYSAARAGINAGYTGLLARLKALLGILDPGVVLTPPGIGIMILASPLGVDPVTGI